MSEHEIVPREPDEMGETLGELTEVSEMRLDLSKDEKVRTVALMLGIRYYTDTIIKDAAYLQAMMAREKEVQFSNDPNKELWHLRPASVHGVIYCAQEFEDFLMGRRSRIASVRFGDEEINPADSGRAQGEVETTE